MLSCILTLWQRDTLAPVGYARNLYGQSRACMLELRLQSQRSPCCLSKTLLPSASNLACPTRVGYGKGLSGLLGRTRSVSRLGVPPVHHVQWRGAAAIKPETVERSIPTSLGPRQQRTPLFRALLKSKSALRPPPLQSTVMAWQHKLVFASKRPFIQLFFGKRLRGKDFVHLQSAGGRRESRCERPGLLMLQCEHASTKTCSTTVFKTALT